MTNVLAVTLAASLAKIFGLTGPAPNTCGGTMLKLSRARDLATAKQKELVEAKIQQYMDEAGANAPPAIRIPEVANAN